MLQQVIFLVVAIPLSIGAVIYFLMEFSRHTQLHRWNAEEVERRGIVIEQQTRKIAELNEEMRVLKQDAQAIPVMEAENSRLRETVNEMQTKVAHTEALVKLLENMTHERSAGHDDAHHTGDHHHPEVKTQGTTHTEVRAHPPAEGEWHAVPLQTSAGRVEAVPDGGDRQPEEKAPRTDSGIAAARPARRSM